MSKKNMKIKEAYPYTKAATKRFGDMFGRLKEPKDEIFKNKVLVVGTQDGYEIYCLRKFGFEVHGTEIDQAYAEYCQEKGYNVLCDNFEKTKVKKKYDLLYSSHVIEHCEKPLKFMESAYKVLNPGGIVFLYFPLEDKTFDKKHFGRMRHRSFWKDLETFREKVVLESKFKELKLEITRKWRTHIEGLFIGEKI